MDTSEDEDYEFTPSTISDDGRSEPPTETKSSILGRHLQQQHEMPPNDIPVSSPPEDVSSSATEAEAVVDSFGGNSPPTPYGFGSTPPCRADSNGLIATSTLRHVRRVSKRAALATKATIWDSNDASIVAAQSAVDQWEEGYNAMRGLLMAMGQSVQGVYGAAKTGANGLEHGLLLPVRDWILMPAFGGMEHMAGETIGFLQSPQAEHLAQQSLGLVRQVPFVGDSLLAPALCIGTDVMKKSWEIAKYPIPSPHQVHDSVDFVLTGTKLALTTAGREVMLYVKRADANITRTLSHTQWRTLGSGPYATLDPVTRSDVIDHICERYYSLARMETDGDPLVARYELAAHIRAHNRPLFHDLVLTGLLRERGGDLTADDVWLSAQPSYRRLGNPFLLHEQTDDDETTATSSTESEVIPLWFRLPYHNGKHPGKDTPWIRFEKEERLQLEEYYQKELEARKWKSGSPTLKYPAPEMVPSTVYDMNSNQSRSKKPQAQKETPAVWYQPDLEKDLLLDQKRHAVSLFPCCPKCRNPLGEPYAPKQFGELCSDCSEQTMEAPWVDALLAPPPLLATYRPTMWRFYGPGDEMRRSNWFLDTKRHGLQPYSDEAQSILEDAYLFLKWFSEQNRANSVKADDGVLLTVEVPSPDGTEQQLVQFSSLDSATAIGKGLGSAIALFKRRVYRGATHKPVPEFHEEPPQSPKKSAQESEGTEEQNCFDEHWVSVPDPPSTSSLSQIDEDLQSRMCLTPKSGTVADNEDNDSERSNDAPPSHSTNAATMKVAVKPCHDELSLAFDLEDLGEEDSERADVETTEKDDTNQVDHLVLVVHGIGEMLQSVDFFGISKLPTIVDCCSDLRDGHSEVLNVRFSQLSEVSDDSKQVRKGRVEYLPVEWHETFTIQSQRRLPAPNPGGTYGNSGCSIDNISLRTIPQMRQFANDTLMDVLFFMSPEHHDIIIDIVVSEMNLVVKKFRNLTGFQGNISIVGHSLGSIIAWDILDQQAPNPVSPTTIQPKDRTPSSQSLLSTQLEAEASSPVSTIEDGDSQITKFPQLSFHVDTAFMLGSPIAVFLMIRNQRQPLKPDFSLRGCRRVFNIFHPFDPVAYRMEPLLDPHNAEIEPRIVPHWHGGYRFQYQTKRLWRQLVQHTRRTQENVAEKLESGIAALGLLDGASNHEEEDHDADDDHVDDTDDVNSYRRGQRKTFEMGKVNRGQRIDYMLQERGLESAGEYVAALAAHSGYWMQKDLSLFLARQICLVALEREVGKDKGKMSPTAPPTNSSSFF